MLVTHTEITDGAIVCTSTFDTDSIPLELIESDLEHLKATIENQTLYNIVKNTLFVFIRTDVVATLYTDLVKYCNNLALTRVRRYKLLPRPIPDKCASIRDLGCYTNRVAGIGSLTKQVILTFNHFQKLLLGKSNIELKDNILTITFKG